MRERGRGALSTAGRLLVSLVCGALTCGFVGWDVKLLALVASLYTLGEAGLLQGRQRFGSDLAVLGNLPVHDTQIFDGIIVDTARHALVVFGFACGGFLGAAHRAGCGWPAAALLAVMCAALLWVVVLAAAAIIVAAIPQAPLTVVTAVATLVALVTFHPGQSVLGERVLALPTGWVVRIFAEASERGTADWRLLGLSGLLAVLGWVNIVQIRARFHVPEFAWRRVPAEAVMELLVAEEAGALAQSTATVETLSDGGDLLRMRAARQIELSIREAVVRGTWRESTRPRGPVEQLLWRLLPGEHRSLAPFVAPMGRGVTDGFERAAIVTALALVGAAFDMPLFVQALALVVVTVLCLWADRPSPLPPCVLERAIPVDPAQLLLIALELTVMRAGLWFVLLMVQAATLEGGGALPGAVGMALRLAMLVLALQPLLAVMPVGAVDEEAAAEGPGLGLLGALLGLPALAFAGVAAAVIMTEPYPAEFWVVVATAVLSLATFVLYGARLGCVERSR